jgi:hypothetical protein
MRLRSGVADSKMGKGKTYHEIKVLGGRFKDFIDSRKP